MENNPPEGAFNDNILSKRGCHVLSTQSANIKYLKEAHQNAFHPQDNPQGIVDLGRASNCLMEKEMEERLNGSESFHFTSAKHQHYFHFNGSPSLKRTIAAFYQNFFHTHQTIHPEDLTVLSGAASCLDSLSHVLFDPGDIYLTPVPTYGRIFTNFNDRSLAHPHPLQLPEEATAGGEFALTPELLESEILALKKEEKAVRGFVLINPQNPLGDVYPPALVRSLLEICAKYEIHVIIDEVYVLSLTDKNAEVRSVLSIPDIPDPQRTHSVWALTKDFGLAGLRVGVVHTKNKDVTNALRSLSIYCPTPSIIQDVADKLLKDTEWLENVYMPKYRERLSDWYNFTKRKLEEIGVKVRPSQAGLFVWANFKDFLQSQTKEGEIEFFEEIFAAGVNITPGCWLHCSSPGWFRIVFAIPMEQLEIGLARLEQVLKGKN